MTQGFTLQNKIAQVPVGSISTSMLKDLCSWLRKKGELEMAILASDIFYTHGPRRKSYANATKEHPDRRGLPRLNDLVRQKKAKDVGEEAGLRKQQRK
jgi:hypothetical protein